MSGSRWSLSPQKPSVLRPGMATSMVATLGNPTVSSRTFPSRPNLARCDGLVAVSGGLPRMSAFSSLHTKKLLHAHIAKATMLEDGAGGGGIGGWQGRGGGGSGDGDEDDNDDQFSDDANKKAGILGSFQRGWRRRVRADPQFGFKVFSEVVIGVTACVLGDMASRPNFGLNELDFVFSTIVVGSILNFTLMYMLAPTAAAGQASKQLPLLFATCPPGHMFEPGRYSLLDRAGTFLYKGVQFAGVGFVAGMAGTELSNLLLSVRKRVDPKFEVQNPAPPTVLNALTWAGHMGLSSNARYQTLNGLEFALAGALHPSAFKSAVFVLRGINNVLGGVTFVMLARRTGSQTASKPDLAAPASDGTPEPMLLAQKA